MFLPDLRLAASAAQAAFEAECARHYVDGQWGFYRALDRGEDAPPETLAASDAYLAATHAFYLARDGAAGFLGSKGL